MQPNDHNPPHAATWRRIAIGCLCVLAMVFAAGCVYVPTLHYDMIFDDLPGIVDNESIQQLTPLFGTPGGYGPLNPQPDTPFTARPLVSLTLALNYHFGQADPTGYRIVHIALHILAAMLLWAIVAATLSQPVFGGRWLPYRQAISFSAAMLWMVHPVHTETIVYLTQRTELLMGVFYLLTVYLAIRFWHSTHWLARVVWCLAAFVASVGGMLSKEMMASVPAMVAVYEWTFIGGSLWVIAKRSWLLYLALTLSWIPLAVMYAYGYATPLGGFGNMISAHDWWLTQANAFFVYWRLVFIPWPLLLHYHVPTLSTFDEAWGGVLGLTVYALATMYFLWRRSATGFVMLWFFAVLSPTLIVPLPHEEISERRLYVPLLAVIPYLGVCLVVAWQYIWQRFAKRQAVSDVPAYSFSSVVFAQVVMFTLVAGAGLQCTFTLPRLKSTQTIWLEVLKHQPQNTYAICSQGSVEFNRGEHETGLEKIQFAFESDRSYHFFRLSLLGALNQMQLYDRLLVVCRQMQTIDPNDAMCAYNLGTALEKTGNGDDAIQWYRKAIGLDPQHREAHSSLATLLAERNQVAAAIEQFEIAIAIKPDFMDCLNLTGIYLSTRQEQQALRTSRLLLVEARKESSPEVIEKIERGIRELERQFPLGPRPQ